MLTSSLPPLTCAVTFNSHSYEFQFSGQRQAETSLLIPTSTSALNTTLQRTFMSCRTLIQTEDTMSTTEITNVFTQYVIFLTAIWLSPGGSSTLHIYKQAIHRITQKFRKSAGRAPSWIVIPWHLPYNRGKSTVKPQSG